MSDEGKKRKQHEKNQQYLEANKEQEAERLRLYYEANQEKIRSHQAAYYEANREKRKAYYRKRYHSLKAGKGNPGVKPRYYCEKCNALMRRIDNAQYPLADGGRKVLCRTCNNDWTFAADGSLVKRQKGKSA